MLTLLFSCVILLLAFPTIMFVLECLLGLHYRNKGDCALEPDDISAAILVPAHNEALVIASTLENLKAQLGPNDQVVVIADNCQDETAEIVRKHGLTAIERSSETERGKGYALAFGMEHLKSQDTYPDVVVIVDADCLLAEKALATLKTRVIAWRRPVQACYLMLSGEVERLAVKVSEFAFLVKNKIRLRGLSKMGMPVPLTGTGMAFPWSAISEAQLATGDIVEDMRLGVELAEKGLGARYCDEAFVYSYFPTSETAEATQRERWEHGHLSTLQQFAPRLLKRAIKSKSIEAFGMMLDLIIPPLTLLIMFIGGAWSLFLLYGVFSGSWMFFELSSQYLFVLMFTILLTWFCHAQHILSAKALLHIPIYMFSKIAIYIAYIVRKQTKWIRTDRH